MSVANNTTLISRAVEVTPKMLTKELLKYRVRTGRAVPLLIEKDDKSARVSAADILMFFKESEGLTLDEIEDSMPADGPLAPAFAKLILAKCGLYDDDAGIEDLRWRAFLAAGAMLKSGAAVSADEYRAGVALALGVEAAEELQAQLYADLPGCKKISGIPGWEAEDLVARYNVGQVQGLLLTARSITIDMGQAKVGEKRELFRQIKFHRLLCEVDGQAVTLSGPLSIFDQAATYGARLANFFPHVLHIGEWTLEAALHLKKRDLTLKLDHKSGLISHLPKRSGYVPEELSAFTDAFNEQQKGKWVIGPGEDFFHVGHESYCFPDLTITGHKSKKKVHVELFHKWHKGQLLGRLEALEKSGVSGLLVGVAKSVAQSHELAERLKSSPWFAKNGFIFAEFPTPKTVAACLSRRDEAC